MDWMAARVGPDGPLLSSTSHMVDQGIKRLMKVNKAATQLSFVSQCIVDQSTHGEQVIRGTVILAKACLL